MSRPKTPEVGSLYRRDERYTSRTWVICEHVYQAGHFYIGSDELVVFLGQESGSSIIDGTGVARVLTSKGIGYVTNRQLQPVRRRSR